MKHYRSIQDLAKENLAKWKDLQKNDTQIKCAIHRGNTLNDNIPAFRKGELNVIAGHICSGRTFLFSHMALIMSEHAKVLFCSFEWSQQAVTAQLFSILVKTEWKLRNTSQTVNKNHIQKWTEAEEKLATRNLLIDSNDIESLDTWLDELEHTILETGTEVILVDELHAHPDFFNPKSCDKYKKMLLKGLRKLAEEKNVCIIISWRVNQIIEDWEKKPFFNLLDITDTQTGIIEAAHQILMLRRPAFFDAFGYIKENEMILSMLKTTSYYPNNHVTLYANWKTAQLSLDEHVDNQQVSDSF